jgi:hypothetical protein
MIKLTIGALGLLAVMGQDAVAGDKPSTFHRVSCSVVRFYVAKYSAGAAESFARSRGATDADIESARRCLTPNPVQTASVVR